MMTGFEATRRRKLRIIAEKSGHHVRERSSHGPSKAWDWGPKSATEANHFRSADEAWIDLQNHIDRQIKMGRELIKLADEVCLD